MHHLLQLIETWPEVTEGSYICSIAWKTLSQVIWNIVSDLSLASWVSGKPTSSSGGGVGSRNGKGSPQFRGRRRPTKETPFHKVGSRNGKLVARRLGKPVWSRHQKQPWRLSREQYVSHGEDTSWTVRSHHEILLGEQAVAKLCGCLGVPQHKDFVSQNQGLWAGLERLHAQPLLGCHGFKLLKARQTEGATHATRVRARHLVAPAYRRIQLTDI